MTLRTLTDRPGLPTLEHHASAAEAVPETAMPATLGWHGASSWCCNRSDFPGAVLAGQRPRVGSSIAPYPDDGQDTQTLLPHAHADLHAHAPD